MSGLREDCCAFGPVADEVEGEGEDGSMDLLKPEEDGWTLLRLSAPFEAPPALYGASSSEKKVSDSSLASLPLPDESKGLPFMLPAPFRLLFS